MRLFFYVSRVAVEALRVFFPKKKAGGKGQNKKEKARCEVHLSWEESRAPEEQDEGWSEAMCLVIARGKPWAFRIHKG